MTDSQIILMFMPVFGLLWFSMFSLLAECITKEQFFDLDISEWKMVYRVLLKISFIFLWPVYFAVGITIGMLVGIIKTIIAIFE